MFNAKDYTSSSIAIRLSDLQNALEYSLMAEYNTHVVQLRSGVFFVSTEDGAKTECEWGGRLIAIRGEMVS